MDCEDNIYGNDSINDTEENVFVHEDNQSEMKEEALDLTIHCEPTLIEEEDVEEENNLNDGLNITEECVDPLEFLEVDQSSVDGSADVGDESPEPIDLKTDVPLDIFSDAKKDISNVRCLEERNILIKEEFRIKNERKREKAAGVTEEEQTNVN